MINIFLILSLCAILAYAINLVFAEPSGWLNHKAHLAFLENFKTKETNFLEEIELKLNNKNPQLSKLIGKRLLLKFVIPLVIIFSLSTLVIGPYLAGYRYGIVLGLVIFLAYGLRLSYHLVSKFRTRILEQIERVLISIRNNLSSGQVLDYAVNYTATNSKFEPIGSHLNNFIKNNNINLLEAFPDWLKVIEREYRISELTKFAQLLKLELKYNSNQEEAFINTVGCITEKNSQNKKQKNTISITFLTLDFMVLAFLGVIFFVIPQLSFNSEINWWQSERRSLVLFASSLVIWLAYCTTIFISFWRTK